MMDRGPLLCHGVHLSVWRVLDPNYYAVLAEECQSFNVSSGQCPVFKNDGCIPTHARLCQYIMSICIYASLRLKFSPF
jgi:hypothetical protein